MRPFDGINPTLHTLGESQDEALRLVNDPIHIINVCIKDTNTTIEKQEEEKESFQKVILEKVCVNWKAKILPRLNASFPMCHRFLTGDGF